jgi:hypothetical protein
MADAVSAVPDSGQARPLTNSTSQASALPRSTAAVIRRIPDSQWRLMRSTGTWRSGCPVGRSGLRDVDVSYLGFDGHVHRGTLVVRADVARSVATVFARLLASRYPIRRILPAETYGGDDNRSMAADNTSAFNCRRAGQANAPSAASPHANGRAIDLNPYENPWLDPRCGCFRPDRFFGTHRTGVPGAAGRAIIRRGGAAWRAFVAAGWIWQDSSTTDYQHFDTGYPSRPLG